ncbi:MAG: CBS domain-containing protein [Candidatus Jettenia sp.]|uniref:CBS domain-containing protein n=1 Tax=Candidatus Jettenia caeni TaxID=247490 RepID=I3IIM1_9BACT|nr:CBS domain-containing protein [Candidatus Jettenia sp. AMX1]MBC6929839.1 CBS domain-containing protein [Candidatus Jettenia sp.]NUN24053.1 CBS domain-containing protein [Candidatus Jettenia caeni]KAA0248674.1 MAG: CBS domain-containing protein [Candidatus Jettenia sp. AMX1]MCE7881987.1 CBS domain-containing protein [Candidatus Jettenia sp. AMX1]MCQ3928070.1 CBS domain-containing protein [Candidatus Jettenia sp.]
MKQLDPISHVMTTSLKTVQIHQKLSEVRRIFIENQLHHVPVVHDRKLVGLISTTDMLRLNLAVSGTNSWSIDTMLDQQFTIEQVMQRNLVTIDIHSTVRKAAHLLSDGVFHSLPVVDKDNNLVGIITSTDLIRYLARLC